MSKDLDEVIKIIDATAFEKGKTYLINIDCGDLPKEYALSTLQHIKKMFDDKGIDVIMCHNHIKIEAIEIKKEEETTNG